MTDYPTDHQLELISTWKPDDFHGLLEYIRPLWQYADSGYWKHKGDVYRISTAGWSGNEDIIEAMQHNIVWWMLYWHSSRVGGHYMFRKRKA